MHAENAYPGGVNLQEVLEVLGSVAVITPCLPRGQGMRVARLGAAVGRHVLVMGRALWLVVRRARDVPEDGAAIRYSGQVRPMMWVFLVLNPVEIGLIELAVPWQVPRVVLTVLGVLSTVWFLALVATTYKYPHCVDPRVLRLRYCSFYDYRIPVADIEAVVLVRRERGISRSSEVVDGTLVLEVVKTTNISVVLRREYRADLGLRGIASVRAVDFWADDPAEAARLIRARLS